MTGGAVRAEASPCEAGGVSVHASEPNPEPVLLEALHTLIHLSLNLFVFVLIVTVVSSWLIAFGIVNRHNQFVATVLQTCYALTEPVLSPIRRMLPSFGGIDISPIIVLIGIEVLKTLLHNTVFEGIGY